DLKVVLMTSAPTDDLHREAVQSGAIRLLTTPLDLEDLLFSLSAERKGALSYLEGDLDVTDICTLLAACQASGGVRLRQGERAGSLVLRGATLIHAATEELTGAAALDRLRGWGNWYFESLSAFETAHLPVNCGLEITGGSAPREEVKAFGTLRGLALHHLLEWAISRQETCLLTVTAGAKTGVLRFEDGRVRSAETPEREGGRAAAEILSWDNVRVQLTRPQTAEWSTAVNTEAVQALIDRFSDEVEGIIATCVVRRDGSPIAGRSLEPELDFARAAGRYAKVLESHFAAVEDLGVGLTWGRTEDLVITLGGAYLLVRLLGHRHYHWLLVSNESNLAFCRLRMQGYAGPLAQSLEDVGEILSASLPAV
ncbi:MAG TPA: DUF4388 domain-containing protein, partial [Thermoanaerobaculia bacterium]|nr:DUF4388 domain-containing protein [Thermoanaerobaculia bacterium]